MSGLFELKEHQNSADYHSYVDDVFQLLSVEFVEDLSAEEVAADTADDADQAVEDELGRDKSVYRAVRRGVEVGHTEIKLNGGKIRDVIGRCARKVEHRGWSARREKSAERTAERSRNDAVRNRRLYFYPLIEEKKVNAEDDEHRAEKYFEKCFFDLSGEIDRDRY